MSARATFALESALKFCVGTLLEPGHPRPTLVLGDNSRIAELPCVLGTMALTVASTSTFLKGGALRRSAPTRAQARRVPNR